MEPELTSRKNSEHKDYQFLFRVKIKEKVNEKEQQRLRQMVIGIVAENSLVKKGDPHYYELRFTDAEFPKVFKPTCETITKLQEYIKNNLSSIRFELGGVGVEGESEQAEHTKDTNKHGHQHVRMILPEQTVIKVEKYRCQPNVMSNIVRLFNQRVQIPELKASNQERRNQLRQRIKGIKAQEQAIVDLAVEEAQLKKKLQDLSKGDYQSLGLHYEQNASEERAMKKPYAEHEFSSKVIKNEQGQNLFLSKPFSLTFILECRGIKNDHIKSMRGYIWSSITTLSLGGNSITEEGLKDLCAISWDSLEKFYLCNSVFLSSPIQSITISSRSLNCRVLVS